MSNRDGFAGGFIAGAAVGGLAGAVLGVVLSKRAAEASLDPSEAKARKRSNGKGGQLEGERIEVARLSLEDKIAQLNQAIDDVRLQLGDVNGNVQVDSSQSSMTEDS
jgi:hypothetical protein